MSGDNQIPNFTEEGECHVSLIVNPKMALDVPVQCSFKNLLCFLYFMAEIVCL